MKRKKFMIVLLIIFIIYLIMLFILPIKIKTSEGTPTTSYDISINKFSRKLNVKTLTVSSTVEHSISNTNNTVFLTSNEYWKIWFIYYFKPFSEKRMFLSSILETIARDTDEFGNNELLEYDLNNDGIVTYREFGSNWLNQQ